MHTYALHPQVCLGELPKIKTWVEATSKPFSLAVGRRYAMHGQAGSLAGHDTVFDSTGLRVVLKDQYLEVNA